MTYLDVELALARKFDHRTNLIVPNVSWGLGFNHELDLAVLTHSGYLWEIEIKMTKSDLKRDKQKSHGHYSNRIARLYFAFPEEIDGDEIRANVPERAGIAVVRTEGGRRRPYADIVQTPVRNRDAVTLEKHQQERLLHLAAMRIWTLKEHMNENYKRLTKKAGLSRLSVDK